MIGRRMSSSYKTKPYPIINPSFELWENGLPAGWSVEYSDGFLSTNNSELIPSTYYKSDGVYSLYYHTDTRIIGYLRISQIVVIPQTATQLKITCATLSGASRNRTTVSLIVGTSVLSKTADTISAGASYSVDIPVALRGTEQEICLKIENTATGGGMALYFDDMKFVF